jgi:hypothetical protein
VSERTADETGMPEDHPSAEEVFAGRVARLVGLVDRWHAQVETERWPAVPSAGLGRDDPRRLALEAAEELLRARGHLLAAVERVRSAARLRRRMREGPAEGPPPPGPVIEEHTGEDAGAVPDEP